MLSGFYEGFAANVQRAQGEMAEAVQQALVADLPAEALQRLCPQCGRPLAVRLGSRGRFLACSGYPACGYTAEVRDTETQTSPEAYSDERCGQCGGRMKIITRGASRFLGCENYPRCKNTRPILSAEIQSLAQTTACPTCGQTPLEPRSGRYGEYLHCPACRANLSLRKLGLSLGGERSAPPAETVDIACPTCGHRPLEKRVGRYGPYYRCPGCKQNISEKKLTAQT